MTTWYLQTLLGSILFWSLQVIFQNVFLINGPSMVANLASAPSLWLWSTTVDDIFSVLASDSFTFLPGLPRPSQKFQCWSQYEIGVSFYRTMYDPFVLNNILWAIPYFLLYFSRFINTTRSLVPNYLMIFPLLYSYIYIILLSDTRMLHDSLCVKRSENVASMWSNACCPYEVPSLDLSGYR